MSTDTIVKVVIGAGIVWTLILVKFVVPLLSDFMLMRWIICILFYAPLFVLYKALTGAKERRDAMQREIEELKAKVEEMEKEE